MAAAAAAAVALAAAALAVGEDPGTPSPGGGKGEADRDRRLLVPLAGPLLELPEGAKTSRIAGSNVEGDRVTSAQLDGE